MAAVAGPGAARRRGRGLALLGLGPHPPALLHGASGAGACACRERRAGSCERGLPGVFLPSRELACGLRPRWVPKKVRVRVSGRPGVFCGLPSEACERTGLPESLPLGCVPPFPGLRGSRAGRALLAGAAEMALPEWHIAVKLADQPLAPKSILRLPETELGECPLGGCSISYLKQLITGKLQESVPDPELIGRCLRASQRSPTALFLLAAAGALASCC